MSESRNESEDEDQRGPGAFIAAAILIGVGLILLLQHFGVPLPENWWALFLLIPAVGALPSAWRIYEQNGRRYTTSMNGVLITAALFLLLTVVFLFNLHIDWGLIWPLILIVLGIAALTRAYWRKMA
jgi:hypothetical protein